MFASLLVGLDGSSGADAALDSAIALGRRFHSAIVLAAVVDARVLEAPLLRGGAGDWPPSAAHGLGDVMSERADRLLDAGAARAKDAGLPAQTLRAVGMVDEELLELATATEALVVGRRGEQLAGDRLGSHTLRLVRRAPHPVVVAGRESTFEHPIVAYDGSDTAGAALILAARYAVAAGVPVEVVHVGESGAASAAFLAQAEAYLSQTDAEYETHALTGENVAEAVAVFAERSGGDAVVCGAHRGHGRRSWSIGSRTEALLAATDLPTIIVR